MNLSTIEVFDVTQAEFISVVKFSMMAMMFSMVGMLFLVFKQARRIERIESEINGNSQTKDKSPDPSLSSAAES